MTRRVLIISVSAGAGHLRAAAAVEAALAERHPDVETLNIDAMDYVSAGFRRLYKQGYLQLVNHAPTLWGYIYSRTGKQKRTGAAARLGRLVARLNARKLIKTVRSFAPDEVLAVHPLPVDILCGLKRRGKFAGRISVVVTDFDVHPLWIDPAADRYFASCEEVAHLLARRGIAREKTIVTGIPVMPSFARRATPADRARVRKALGLHPGKPAVLTSAGGFGVGRVAEAIGVMAAAAGRAGGAGIVAVAGRNSKLRARIAALSPPRGVRLVSLGFRDDMHDLMAAADLMVSKPGGLTSSECLARRLPMLIVDPIPGQEERNAAFLLAGGAAWEAAGPDSLDYKLAKLLADPAQLARMRRAAACLARPRACFEIAAALAAE